MSHPLLITIHLPEPLSCRCLLESLGYCNSWYPGGTSDDDYTLSINGDCRYQARVGGLDDNYITLNNGPEPNSQPGPILAYCNVNGALYATCPREAVEYWHYDD